MKSATPSAWRVPALLLLLSAVPVIGGATRLATVAAGVEVIPGNGRFFAAPVAVTVHILSAGMFCVLGAFQVSSAVRRHSPAWHRRAGRVLVPAGLTAALSGLWLTFVYPPGELDGPVLFAVRLVAGVGMATALALGAAAIRRRDIAAHRAWMIRALALALGAGTQVFTHIPLEAFPALQNEAGRTLAMAAGWMINLTVAEWIIRAGAKAAAARITGQTERRSTPVLAR